MREIKFRAWNKNDKVMITDLNSPSLFHGVLVHDSDDILMQYTGLTDKNGKEIYEGDIVDDQFDCGQLMRIYYFEDEACFRSERLCYKLMGTNENFHCNLSISPETTTKGVVVGNIYESPELLEDLE